MATFNNTSVYLNTRAARNGVSIRRVPVPQANESFYFNQNSIRAIVSYYTNNNELEFKESKIASIHLTNKRLILLSQSTTTTIITQQFDTCEFQLSDFQSLKIEIYNKSSICFEITTIRNEKMKMKVTFATKKEANRRDALKEYIKMATSAILSTTTNPATVRCFQQRQQMQQEELPSYLEATRSGTFNNDSTRAAVPPPAYS